MADGTAVTTLAQWSCRQQELSQIIQKYELGVKPGAPSTFTSSYSGGTLTLNAGEAGKSISFTVRISGNTAANSPAIIAFGGASIPVPAGVATITFSNDDIAAQANTGSRGQGKFYTLYGSGHSAGAMSAWAWGVSRIIDGIIANPSTNIDPKRIGVTGCSRNGKGAFVAGALDDRIALTIPQESGAGGAACWRVSDSEKKAGKNIQTASQIITENVWLGKSFESYVSNTANLPHDHHELAGLVAPRGLYVIENDIDWLGPGSTTVCMKIGRLIYKAAGVPDAMGFSLAANHGHCSFPSSQQSELTAFINKYLLNGSASTANIEKSVNTINAASWIDWTPPTLT